MARNLFPNGNNALHNFVNNSNSPPVRPFTSSELPINQLKILIDKISKIENEQEKLKNEIINNKLHNMATPMPTSIPIPQHMPTPMPSPTSTPTLTHTHMVIHMPEPMAINTPMNFINYPNLNKTKTGMSKIDKRFINLKKDLTRSKLNFDPIKNHTINKISKINNINITASNSSLKFIPDHLDQLNTNNNNNISSLVIVNNNSVNFDRINEPKNSSVRSNINMKIIGNVPDFANNNKNNITKNNFNNVAYNNIISNNPIESNSDSKLTKKHYNVGRDKYSPPDFLKGKHRSYHKLNNRIKRKNLKNNNMIKNLLRNWAKH
jgi:hypothetical protein